MRDGERSTLEKVYGSVRILSMFSLIHPARSFNLAFGNSP